MGSGDGGEVFGRGSLTATSREDPRMQQSGKVSVKEKVIGKVKTDLLVLLAPRGGHWSILAGGRPEWIIQAHLCPSCLAIVGGVSPS